MLWQYVCRVATSIDISFEIQVSRDAFPHGKDLESSLRCSHLDPLDRASNFLGYGSRLIGVTMATEKTPRSPSSAQRTTKTKQPASKPPTTERPVSTSQVTEMSARNNVQTSNDTPDIDAVRRRAYELYEARGRKEGFHEEDWRRAETEVLGRNSGRKDNKRSA
jgi:hypothetical protein